MESQDVNVVASCNSEQSTKASTTYPSSSAFEQPPSEQKEEEPIQTNRTEDAVSVCDSAYHSFLNFVGTSATDYYTKRIYDEDVHAVASVDTFDFEDANVDSNIEHDVVSVVTDYFTAGGTSHIDNGGNNKDTSPRLMHDESKNNTSSTSFGTPPNHRNRTGFRAIVAGVIVVLLGIGVLIGALVFSKNGSNNNMNNTNVVDTSSSVSLGDEVIENIPQQNITSIVNGKVADKPAVTDEVATKEKADEPLYPLPTATPSASPSWSPSMAPSVASSNEPSSSPSSKPSEAKDVFDVAESDVFFSTETNNTNTTPNISPVQSPTLPTPSPEASVTTSQFTSAPITAQPTSKPDTPTPTRAPSPCFSVATYDEIDADVAKIKNSITSSIERSHFLGGIVRLAAHDFMDYDRRSTTNSYGSDGCFESDMDANAGLPESTWCKSCMFRTLYEVKYSHISRADFWIASANAVIRQTSVNNALDMKEEFTWGRVDTNSCSGSADRLPSPSGCDSTEGTFLTRMGMSWRETVALMGAHSLGRGSRSFSGHEGVWVDNADDAQVFDKQYYEEIYLNAWRPRNIGEQHQDWTTGQTNSSHPNPRMMLNTDICLVYDIDDSVNCCSRIDQFLSEGGNQCLSNELSGRNCPFYSQFSSRREAADAVLEFVGGSFPNTNNEPFYTAFTAAWVKATGNGWSGLSPLAESCETQNVFA